MPAVRCPIPGCDYVTDNLDTAIVVALLNAHSESHKSGQAFAAPNSTASSKSEDVPKKHAKPNTAQKQLLCYWYNSSGCQKADSCTYIHMCQSYVESRCESGRKCEKSHNIFDPAVKPLLEKHGIDTKRKPGDVLADLRATVKGDKNKSSRGENKNPKAETAAGAKTSKHFTPPKLCYQYNGNGCQKSDSCTYIHMCKSYVESRCESGKECDKSHNVFDPAVKVILENHGIDTKRKPRDVLADLRASVKSDQNKESKKPKADKSDERSTQHTPPKLCFAYSGSGCQKGGSCTYIHMCRNYVESSCESGKDCDKNHNIFHPAVKAILEKHGIDTKRNHGNVLVDLRAAVKADNSDERSTQHTSPKLCFAYSGSGCQKVGSCTYIHMCRNYVESRCESGKNCDKSHDICDPKVKAILEKHGIDTKRKPRDVLADLQAAVKNDDSQKGRAGAGDVKATKTGKSPGKVSRKTVCYFNLRGRCRWNFCPNVHCELPYQWRIKRTSEKEWTILNEQDNIQVEQAFCSPANQVYRLQTEQGVTITIDFNTMTGTGTDEQTNYKVRRLSTPSFVELTHQPWATVWLWYSKNSAAGNWTKCEDTDDSTGKISNNDIEQAYINNPDGKIECGSPRNFIDFSKMIRVNMDDMTLVEVTRRPTFVSEMEAKERKKPVAKKRQPDLKGQETERVSRTVDIFAPPPSWNMSPGEDITDHCQLIVLPENGPEYKEIEAFFHESLPSTVHIRSIERIENGDLWENFVSKRTKMLKKKSKEEVGERRLFHGTRNQYIDPIWHQGFDFRLSGQTSGTVYGQGSYFATNARYSDSYAEQGAEKAMFVVKALPGAYVLGRREYKRPPHKDKENPCSELYDSCVNNESIPQIFVIFDNNQIYPEYLIKYK